MRKVLFTLLFGLSSVSTLMANDMTQTVTYFKVDKQSDVYHNNKTEYKIKVTKQEIILMERDGFAQSYTIIKQVSKDTKRNKVVYKIEEGTVTVEGNTVTFEFNN
nr:MAG TPA: hypothetical protein [Caudoviricetes sp.]